MSRVRSALFPFISTAVAAAITLGVVPSVLAQGDATAKAAPAAAGQPEVNPNRHIRVLEEDGGKTLKLQLSSRRFVPADPNKKGPAIYLTGAVHVADQSFYDDVQTFLDAKDVVLFESVKPPGAGALKHFEQTDEQRVTATKRRIQLLALFVEQYKLHKQEYPAELSQLPAGIDPKLAKILDGMDTDAWGHALIYRLDTKIKPAPSAPATPSEPGENAPVAKDTAVTTFDLVSYGSDNKEGGDDAASDILYSKQTPVNVKSLAKEDGIQAQLADAMGLVFQLDAMSHERPNWRNSDLSVDQVQDRLEMGGGSADADQLFSMLSGDSFIAKLGGFVLKVVGMFPSLSNSMKMMMVDMLASADKLLENMPGEQGKGLNAMMDVIIKDRNKVVIEDLAGIIENEPDVKTVGVLYGAGHLPDLEERLVNELGYRLESDQWFTAISVDVTTTGMSVKEANSMRKMIKRTIDQQIKAAQKKQK